MKSNYQTKIKNFPALIREIAKHKKDGKIIVHCHGVFDLIHPGHIRHLESAKNHGDILIVTITADKFVNKGPGRPIFNQDLRAEVLASIETVDYVAVVNSFSAIDSIKKLKPDYYVKGPDYIYRKKISKIPRKLDDEEKTVKYYGGKLIFTDDIVYSSSKLINEHLDVYSPATKKYLDLLRSKYNADFVISQLNSLSSIKTLIIGDAIIDQYHYCLPLGKSSKEPVMVHQYISDESFIGGTLATANHLSSLVDDITLVTLLGSDKSSRRLISKKLKKKITRAFFYQNNGTTVIKRRFIDENTKQKLFQISFLKEDFILSEKIEREILDFLKSELHKYQLVVVNDFGHGLMTEKIVRQICSKANFLALNVQANSANYGFNIVTKYPIADYVCIDEQEIRLATHDRYSNIQDLIKKIYKKMKCKKIIVTKGPKGAIFYSQETGFISAQSLTAKIVDRVGAGDALFAITAPCAYKDVESTLIPFLGNAAGAIKVQVVGNKKQIEFPELTKFITRLLK
jgi:rfaE bifunctional protein kinase chain/domain/rfaE bifunctional protein nucleotidyltransferase chain/domain